MGQVPELPAEVLDRLAGCETVRLQVGLLGSNSPVTAVAVPVRGELFVLFRSTPEARAQMEATTAASILAEGADGTWSVLCRGRLLHGRTAQGETRRNELAHWVPDDQPAAWTAGRFYAEHLDYQRETTTGRSRASGPLPGLEPFARWRYYRELAFDPFQLWFFVAGVLIAVGILWMDAQDAGTPAVLLLAIAATVLPVMAGRVLLAPLDLERWRAGKESDEWLGTLTKAYLSPAEFHADGMKIAAAATLAWVGLGILAGSAVTALVSLLSGAPVLLLAMAVRRRFGGAREDRR